MKTLTLLLSAIALLFIGCDKMEPSNNSGTNGSGTMPTNSVPAP